MLTVRLFLPGMRVNWLHNASVQFSVNLSPQRSCLIYHQERDLVKCVSSDIAIFWTILNSPIPIWWSNALRWNAVFLTINTAGALRRKLHSEHCPFLWHCFMMVGKSAMGIVTIEHKKECTCLVEDYPSLRRSHRSQSDYYASQSRTVFHCVLESYAPHWGYVDLSMWSKIRN